MTSFSLWLVFRSSWLVGRQTIPSVGYPVAWSCQRLSVVLLFWVGLAGFFIPFPQDIISHPREADRVLCPALHSHGSSPAPLNLKKICLDLELFLVKAHGICLGILATLGLFHLLFIPHFPWQKQLLLESEDQDQLQVWEPHLDPLRIKSAAFWVIV